MYAHIIHDQIQQRPKIKYESYIAGQEGKIKIGTWKPRNLS
jgi:hypothetical protein